VAAVLSVNAFADTAAARPFVWGAFDCALFAAEWVRAHALPDPGAPWRGRYRTRLGCERLLKREGGIVEVMARGAAIAQLTEAPKPAAGDVGVVYAAVMRRGAPDIGLVGGLCLGGERWAVLTDRGISVFETEAVKAWSLPHA